MNEYPKAVLDVIEERRRQVCSEGWTPSHDDQHGDGAMSIAAACYALWDQRGPQVAELNLGKLWRWTGWGESWFKPKDPRRNLIRAAALLIAEIERLDRRAANAGVPMPAGPLAQAAAGMAALNEGHDPLCMSVLRGKACTCGVGVGREGQS